MTNLVAQTSVLAADDSALFQLGGIAMAVVLLLVAAGFVVLFIAALISILGSPLGLGMKLVWILIAFAAPFLGCLIWFAIGKRDAYRRVPVGHS